MRRACRLLAFVSTGAIAAAAYAQDTTTYTYDPLGRLDTSVHSGGPNNAVFTKTCFDPAGNRTVQAVGTGTPTCNAPAPTPTPGPTPTPPPPPPPPPGNQPPIAVTDNVTVSCNSGGGYWVLTNDSDPDGDPLTLLSVAGTGPYSISIGNASMGIVGIGGGPTRGNYTATYVVGDGRGGTATGTINIQVVAGGPYC